jgi:hypothetical protein
MHYLLAQAKKLVNTIGKISIYRDNIRILSVGIFIYWLQHWKEVSGKVCEEGRRCSKRDQPPWTRTSTLKTPWLFVSLTA